MATRSAWINCALRAGVLVTGAWALAGCAAGTVGVTRADDPYRGVAQGPTMAAAALPDYRAGQRFVFDDGVAEEVTGVEGGVVAWQRDSGVRYRAYPNFLLPTLYWQSDSGASRSRILGSPSTLWPLQAGRSARFQVLRQRLDEGGRVARTWAQSYQCGVDGTAQVDVPAGRFDTYVVVCGRLTGVGNLRPYRRWYYAPAVGHYVLRIDYRQGAPSRRRALVSMMRPDASGDLAALDRGLDQTLETAPSGQARRLRIADGGQVVTMPRRTLQRDDGVYCRTFEQRFDDSGLRVGMACRERPGRWTVVQ